MSDIPECPPFSLAEDSQLPLHQKQDIWFLRQSYQQCWQYISAIKLSVA
jgi:hypothetical protein